jgi:hypothetical protein
VTEERRPDTCIRCRYFEMEDEEGGVGGLGSCRRNAPVPLTAPLTDALEGQHLWIFWPLTSEPLSDWCGEFKVKET